MGSDLKGRIYAAFYSDDLYDYAHSTPISLDFPTLPPLLQWVICPNDLIDSCSVNFVCVCLCFWCLIFSNLLLKIDSIDRICIIFFCSPTMSAQEQHLQIYYNREPNCHMSRAFETPLAPFQYKCPGVLRCHTQIRGAS